MKKCENPECTNILPPEKPHYCCLKCRRKVNNANSRKKKMMQNTSEFIPDKNLPLKRKICMIMARSEKALTPHQVLAMLKDNRQLITSVRSDMTRLTQKGILVKHGMTIGDHGKPNFTWSYNWNK